jgi:hypothetical protein
VGPLLRAARPDGDPIDVLEVTSDVDSYWRATVLERFNGEYWEGSRRRDGLD